MATTKSKVLAKELSLNTMMKVLPTKGNLVYEYNPLRNYRLTQNKYEYQEQFYTEQELEDTFDIIIDKTYKVVPNATIQNGKKVALENGTAINIPIIAFKNGARQRECDFCYKFSNNALHWFNLCIELASNPSTGDIEAYCYLKDITSQKISAITKDSVLNEDVEYIFWLNKNTKECQFINKSESASWIPESDTIEYDNFISILLKKKIPASDKEKIKDDFNIEKIEEQLLTTSEVRFTYHTRKEDGSIEIKQEKVYYLEKEANILIYVCTDITAITMMENQQNEKLALAIKQAEKANASKSDFLSRMSHDLRTPMNGIMGIAELASKELDDPEALERDIQKIRSSSSYMLGLLNDILDMSKIESGKLEIHQTKASAGNCLENIITLAHVMCDKKNITFYCNKNPDKYRDYIINVDVLHIQQVAMNLISNASKFTFFNSIRSTLFLCYIL